MKTTLGVSRKGNVVAFLGSSSREETQPDRPKHKLPPVDDDIFFHRSQLHIKSRLLYVGRLDPGSKWVVEDIVSYFNPPHSTKKGKPYYEPRSVQEVRHLTDEVCLRRLGSQERRRCAFNNLSYSAIWRLLP